MRLSIGTNTVRWLLRSGALTAALFASMLAAVQAAVPDDLPASMRLWMDGLDVNNNQTIPLDTAPVPTWVSKAGVASLTTSKPALPPTYVHTAGVPQGVNYVESGGVHTLTGGLYNTNEVVASTDIFLVTTATKLPGGAFNLQVFADTGPNGAIRMASHLPWYGGTLFWDHGNLSTGSGRLDIAGQFSGAASAINIKTLWNFYSKSTTPAVISLTRDGVLKGSYGTGISYTPQTGSTFYLGRDYNGVIGEIIIYSRNLATAERVLMQNYLHAKHQLPNALPTGTDLFANGKAAGYRYQLGGLGQSGGIAVSKGSTYGLTLQNINFLADGVYLMAAVKTLFPAPGTGTTQNIDTTVNPLRSTNTWYLQNTGGTGQVSFSVDTAKALGTLPAIGKLMTIMYRGASSQFTTMVAQPVQVTAANQSNITFTVSYLATGEYVLAELVPPDHYEVMQDGQALTCQAKTVTLKACQNAGCSMTVPYAVSGTLTWTGNATGVPFTVNPGTITGGGLGTASVAVTTAQTVSLGGGGWSITPKATPALQCKDLSGAASSCNLTFGSSGFLVTVPSHRSCTPAPVTVEAVQTDASTNRCTPAYASVTRNAIKMFTSYSAPASGTMAANAVVGASTTPIGRSAASPSTHSLTFDATGKTTFNLSYADAGLLNLSVSDTADSGATMQGSTGFTVAPASLAFSNLPGAAIKAGADFNVTLSAMNSCTIPTVTPNFVNQTVAISSSNPQPAQGNATAINSSAILSAATGNLTLQWAEVGRVDVSAKLTNYMGSGMDVVSAATTLGPFKPDHFATTATQACALGNFTYAGALAPVPKPGAPFTVAVTAQAAGGTTTANYAGSVWAKAVTLSNAGNSTGLSNNTVAATDFTAGVAQNSTIYYSLPTATPVVASAMPQLVMRATETADATVSSLRTAPATSVEGVVNMRSGRLYMRNAYGNSRLALPLVLEAQYWNGTTWQRNTDDHCTTVPAASIAMSGWTQNLAACETVVDYASGSDLFLAGLAQNLRLSAPGTANNGSVLLTPNQGTVAPGLTCAGGTPGTADAANVPWLAPATSAHATFGIYKSRLLFRREDF